MHHQLKPKEEADNGTRLLKELTLCLTETLKRRHKQKFYRYLLLTKDLEEFEASTFLKSLLLLMDMDNTRSNVSHH
jgi:hypothetical protein